jgi:hypothetical protein
MGQAKNVSKGHIGIRAHKRQSQIGWAPSHTRRAGLQRRTPGSKDSARASETCLTAGSVCAKVPR